MKQHYVPEVYLKRFAFSLRGDFFAFKIKSKYRTTPKLVNVSSVCYLEDFYTIKNVEDLYVKNVFDEYHIEKKSFKYEKKELNILFNKLESNKKIFKSDTRRIIQILLSLKKRNPSYMNNFSKENTKEIFEKTFSNLKNEMKLLSKEIGNPELLKVYEAIDSKFKEKYETNKLMDALYKGSLIEYERENFPEDQVLFDYLNNLQFNLMFTKELSPFITSDNPGYTIDKGSQVFNLSFSYTNMFVFPISSRCCLVLKADLKEKSKTIYKEVNRKFLNPLEVFLLNRGTAINCNEKVFSSSKDELLTIKSYFEKNAT